MSNANKLFTDIKKDKKELDDVYYGNKTLMTNYNNFSIDLKKDEYKKHIRKLDISNKNIPAWLEHPNPKYTRDIIRCRCQHGMRCRGTRALTTTKPCLALHPYEWEMFSDEYIQYIIDLPIPPKENMNERILPKWIINTSLHPDTIPILTGC
jgi:hypothetical protein